MSRQLLALVALTVTLGLAQTASAETRKVLTIEYPKVGQVCLSKTELADAARRMKELVIPEGAAATLISYSDGTEVTRKRAGLTSPCISHLVPEGIKEHERIASFRALQVAELADEAGLGPFAGTPMLVLGSDLKYRQRDSGAFAIIPRRSQGTNTADRRVEIWITDGATFNNTAAVAGGGGGGGGTTVLAPILLPPRAYGSSAGGGGGAVIYQDSHVGHGQRVAGWTMLSLSVAAIVGGTLSFLQASDSEDLSRRTLDSRQSIEFQDDADTFRQIGGWGVGIGAGFAVLGGVLLLTAPDAEEESASGFSISPTEGGAVVGFSQDW